MNLSLRQVLWLTAGWCLTLGVAVAESPHHDELVNDDGSWKYTNVLIDETSPYLRQHAHNPVDWKPWGEEAFAEARERGVPIFLSVGYSTCYWCHVMERQVFESPAIAQQMNEQFVCVKVDREERPDVDDIYMTATQLMTGSGGWPMSVFLTPPPEASQGDGDELQKTDGSGGENFRGGLLPFWAGTYIPPKPAYGRPSFPEVMDAVSRTWRENQDQVVAQSRYVANAVRQQVAQGGAEGRGGPVTAEMVESTAAQLRQRYDPSHGGFTGPQGPKFPSPSTVALLRDVYQQEPDEALGREIRHTLDRMATGGMYDQVGGGFHRYSVDEQWLVPHFEKMLYDNGQLLELYAQAYEEWGHSDRDAALYARVLRETAEYLLREMRDETGAFWSAQDAEVNTKEGENYVWTADQVRQALAGEQDAERLTALAMKMYGLDRGTNFKDPHHPGAQPVNVLYMPEPMSRLVEFADGDMSGVMRMRERINAVLLKVRDTRDQPGTDDKVLTAWNGLAIAGLARAGQVLDEPRYLEAARGAADAVLENMSQPDGGLYRTMRKGEAKIDAFLEDYAFFAHGLLTLDTALPESEPRYRDEAARLMQQAHDRFAAPAGGYFDTLANRGDLFVRTRGTYDGAIPSGNSQMAHNLLRLVELTDDDAHARRAVLDLRSFSEPMGSSGPGMTHMLRAAYEAVDELPPDWAASLEAPAASGSPTSNTPPVAVQVKPIEGETHAYRLVLNVAEGYHLNANPASDELYIATSVSAEGVELDVTYPPAESETYLFSDQPLDVYVGRVEIVVRAQQPIERLTLIYQPCSDSACLEPVTRTLNLR